jgi:hypothetical protein
LEGREKEKDMKVEVEITRDVVREGKRGRRDKKVIEVVNMIKVHCVHIWKCHD